MLSILTGLVPELLTLSLVADHLVTEVVMKAPQVSCVAQEMRGVVLRETDATYRLTITRKIANVTSAQQSP